MRKKTVLILLLAAIAVSALALGKIAADEAAIHPSPKNYEKVGLIGEYELNGETHPVSGGFWDPGGLNRVVITGHFDREIEKNLTLHMKIANLRVHLFINGRQVYSFGETGDSPPYADSAGNVWGSFPSPGISEKDEIRIELSNVYANQAGNPFESFLDSLRVDSGGSYLLEVFRSSLPNTFFSIFIICLGILFLLAALIVRPSADLSATMLLIGGLSVFSGIWFFIDFNVQSLYLPFGVFWNGLDIVSLTITEAFVLLYLSMHISSRLRGLLIAVVYCDILLLFSGALLQLFGALDYYGLYYVLYALLIAGACALIAAAAYEAVKLRRSITENLLPVLILGAGAIADIICYSNGIANHTLPFKLSFLVFLVLQAMTLSRTVSNLLEESARAELLRGLAYKDPLTGVRNRTSYLEFVARINRELAAGASYGAAVFDVNRLKEVNDGYGHKYGDLLIQNSCRIICQAFKNSPVFRIGGDEFVAILNEPDSSSAQKMAERLCEFESAFKKQNPDYPEVSIACGIAVYDPTIDSCFEDVFSRADWLTYQDKVTSQKEKAEKEKES